VLTPVPLNCEACDEIEELRVLLRKQCEDAENLLNSNDTRRFIGMENTNIVKVLQNVIQYQASLTQTLFKSKGDIISHLSI
jgi:hypothetical protein